MKKINLEYDFCKKIAEQITNEEKSFYQLEKELNISHVTIRRILRDYKLEYKPSNKKISLSNKQINVALEEYENGKSLKDVAKMFNTNENTLNKIFKENNIDIKKTNRYGKHSDFNLHNDIFENIDTEEKAYWLGFILADGYIDKNYQHLEIGLKESDKEHLEKFKKFVNSESKIRYKEKTKSYTLTITSKKICSDLKKHGIENAKSLTCNLNQLILDNPNLKNHYIRGLWDVDGSVYINKKEMFSIGFTGNIEVIKSIKNNISYFKNIKYHNKKETNAYQISIMHNKSLNFIKDIYTNSHIYLERKFNKIIAVCDEKYPSISQIIRTE